MSFIFNASYQFITHVSCRKGEIITEYKRFKSQDLHGEKLLC